MPIIGTLFIKSWMQKVTITNNVHDNPAGLTLPSRMYSPLGTIAKKAIVPSENMENHPILLF